MYKIKLTFKGMSFNVIDIKVRNMVTVRGLGQLHHYFRLTAQETCRNQSLGDKKSLNDKKKMSALVIIADNKGKRE